MVWSDMAEQLKECLIVHAVSICMEWRKVNGSRGGSALWSRKPADWIAIPAVWSVQNSLNFIYFIWLDMAIHV